MILQSHFPCLQVARVNCVLMLEMAAESHHKLRPRLIVHICQAVLSQVTHNSALLSAWRGKSYPTLPYPRAGADRLKSGDFSKRKHLAVPAARWSSLHNRTECSPCLWFEGGRSSWAVFVTQRP